jgi:8-oxo-dGTP pyrophosphatase MutT (NUDIX family)
VGGQQPKRRVAGTRPTDALTRALAAHAAADAAEARDLRRILEFVGRHANPFDRRIREGHLTGSAVVLSATGDKTLLVHHRKLERWLQPGGHAEPDETSGEAVALREAHEETGIAALALHPQAPRPLDLDVHFIPSSAGEPAHQHLDLRYLVVAPAAARLTRAEQESNDLRWFSWSEVPALGLDAGLRRALDKARGWIAGAAP